MAGEQVAHQPEAEAQAEQRTAVARPGIGAVDIEQRRFIEPGERL